MDNLPSWLPPPQSGSQSTSICAHRCVSDSYRPRENFSDEVRDFYNAEAHRGWARLPPAGTGERGHIVVYVAISKSGSDSMRRLFQRRAYAHAEPIGEVRCGCHGQQAISEHICCDLDWLTQPEACWRVPDNSVVVDTHFGFCERAHGRACQYFVLMREPVARLISGYNYYCVNCLEGHCRNAVIPLRTLARCPFMSLLDYARLSGNYYVEHFGDVRGEQVKEARGAAGAAAASAGTANDAADARADATGESGRAAALSAILASASDRALSRFISHRTTLLPLDHLKQELRGGAPLFARLLRDPPWPDAWRVSGIEPACRTRLHPLLIFYPGV